MPESPFALIRYSATRWKSSNSPNSVKRNPSGPVPLMTPFSTRQLCAGIGIQPVRSLPLNSGSQPSAAGAGNRAVAVVDAVSAKRSPRPT